MKKAFLVLVLTLTVFALKAQNSGVQEIRIVRTGVPFLTLAPDSRAAAMGDAAAAASPDAASLNWNTAKLAFVENGLGVSASYAPWLREIVDDMGLMNASGYYQLTKTSTLTAGITYFSLGEIEFTTNTGASAGFFNSRESAVALGYAQKFTQDLSGGLNLKFISSNLTGNQAINGQASKPGRSAAVDLSFYYHRNRPTDVPKKHDIALAATIQNIGGKINYGTDELVYIPTNLKLGANYTLNPDPQNKFTFLVDFNKLLVPTPDENNVQPDLNTVQAIFSSFSDAPGGFGEEMREFNSSVGAEYMYDNLLAIRAGYHFQPNSKGNLKYATIGAGVKLKERYGVDLAYLIPSSASNPLANTWRVTINFLMPSRANLYDSTEEE